MNKGYTTQIVSLCQTWSYLDEVLLDNFDFTIKPQNLKLGIWNRINFRNSKPDYCFDKLEMKILTNLANKTLKSIQIRHTIITGKQLSKILHSASNVSSIQLNSWKIIDIHKFKINKKINFKVKFLHMINDTSSTENIKMLIEELIKNSCLKNTVISHHHEFNDPWYKEETAKNFIRKYIN